MSQSNNIMKAGEIQVKETKGGKEFHAFNWQRQRMIHIGTLSGDTYEKVAVILRQPEPSFALTQSELGALIETGAGFIRIITPEKDKTYSMSVQDFQLHKEAYHNLGYGPQWRVPVGKFSSIAKVAPRNPIVDSPVKEVPREIVKPKDKQSSFFDRWMK